MQLYIKDVKVTGDIKDVKDIEDCGDVDLYEDVSGGRADQLGGEEHHHHSGEDPEQHTGTGPGSDRLTVQLARLDWHCLWLG